MWTTRNRTVNLHVCTHYTQTHVVNSNNKSVIKSSICPWENVALFPSSGLFRITKQLEEVVFVHRVDALLLLKGISALSTQCSKVETQNNIFSIDISRKNWKLTNHFLPWKPDNFGFYRMEVLTFDGSFTQFRIFFKVLHVKILEHIFLFFM